MPSFQQGNIESAQHATILLHENVFLDCIVRCEFEVQQVANS